MCSSANSRSDCPVARLMVLPEENVAGVAVRVPRARRELGRLLSRDQLENLLVSVDVL